VDVPEDAETYIHRVGRTARYESKGNGLMFVMPSEEEGIKAALDKKGIVVEKIKIRTSKTQSIENQLQNLAFQDPDIKYLGQRVCHDPPDYTDCRLSCFIICVQAFVSYLRSVYLHKDKAIFKVDELPADRFAESLGLPGAPKIKFLGREIAKKKKNASRTVAALQAEIAKEEAATKKDESDGEATDETGSSSDEEETELPIDSEQAADEPTASKALKVCCTALSLVFN
jgi:ATP-dependent RNA helicase DDX10/DBP4